jgi:3D (Asp-Asp-Asp) domain-containing protein
VIPVDVQATAYCQAGITASGYHTRFGQVASNEYGFGTVLRLRRPIRGRRHFYVRDRIGSGSRLDIFMPSCWAATQWGRRTVRFTVGS